MDGEGTRPRAMFCEFPFFSVHVQGDERVVNEEASSADHGQEARIRMYVLPQRGRMQ
jgi:hypothetical protein